jgi:outer membrane biosynthesis protein TonB
VQTGVSHPALNLMACNSADRIYARRTVTAGYASLILFLLVILLSGTASRLHGQAAAAKIKRKVLVSYQPVYPYVLHNGHFEGQVRLEATVLANGTVSKVETKGGNPMLAQYGMEAVMKWRYAPAPTQTVEDVAFYFNSNK